MAWINLSSITQLHESFQASENRLQLYFKHSTRCGISKMALKEFEKSGVLNDVNVDFFLLDLLSFRELSNEIERFSGVQHQSPQAIVLKNKEVIYAESHSSINGEKLQSIFEGIL